MLRILRLTAVIAVTATLVVTTSLVLPLPAQASAGKEGTNSSPAAERVAAATAEVRLPNSRQWTMRASDTGREYAIFVAVPFKPAPEEGYPSIYVLDGNAMFFTAVEAVRALERRPDVTADMRALVVGIGYPEGTNIQEARSLDLTPKADKSPGPGVTGGAEEFLSFIEKDLKPRIAREFKINPQRQALIGHSYGGLFTVDTLTRHPESFQTYVGMSSSFWFDEHALARHVADFVKARKEQITPLRVLLTSGEFEQRPAPREWVADRHRAQKTGRELARRGQGSQAQKAARELAQVPGLLVDYQEIPGTDHGSVIPAAIGRAIDFILVGPQSIPPVPSARDYLALSADERYQLRMLVRALPDPVRIPWLNKLKATLEQGLDEAERKRLHDERQEMDSRYGSRPHAVNAD